MQELALPFSKDQFFDVFAAYNSAMWPAQIAAYALASLALAVMWLWPKRARVVVFGALAVMWGWTGVAYQMLFFAEINSIAVGFGVLFVVQAALLLFYGLQPSTLLFSRAARGCLLGLVLIAYPTLIYPLIGLWNGHTYPAAPVFGVTPCPLVIFTFGALLCLQHGAPWALLAIPTLWSVVGGSAAFLLGVPQDWALPLAAAVAMAANVSLRRIA